MKKTLILLLLTALAVPAFCQYTPGLSDGGRKDRVELTQGFWRDRQLLTRDVTLPHQYRMLEQTGRLEAIGGRWRGRTELSPEEKAAAKREGAPHYFWDSDTAKWLEAAALVLESCPSADIGDMAEDVTGRIKRLQQPDGYINSYFTLVEPENRLKYLYKSHELYCAGHLIEAGVAMYEATGDRGLLDCVARYADMLTRTFGPGEGKSRSYDGHEEIELALLRLYGVTGREDYLRLCRHFIDTRGLLPHPWDAETGEVHTKYPAESYVFGQAHMPVAKQRTAEGHAVRAMYLYAAMTRLAVATGDKGMLRRSAALWKDVTGGKQYITGGVGSDSSTEGFGPAYYLPNRQAYCESCASVAFVLWTQALLEADPRAEYADRIETVLYNAFAASISLDGKRFFYTNPLESTGWTHRSEWLGCACCPPNIARLTASVHKYIFTRDRDSIYVGQYIPCRAHIGGTDLELQTEYPFDGRVRLTAMGGSSRLCLRIPGWAEGKASVTINGYLLPVKKDSRGWLTVPSRLWNGDVIELELGMEPVLRHANKRVAADKGKAAVTVGPLVYCAESADNGSLQYLCLADGAPTLRDDRAVLIPCRRTDTGREDTLVMVPYYTWDNREPGEMKVWLYEGQPRYETLSKKTPTLEFDQLKLEGAWMLFADWITSLTPGSSAEFEFDGPAFEVFCYGHRDTGVLEVTIDGAPAGELDEYSPEEHTPISRVFRAPSKGRHRARLTVTDRRNEASAGNYVNLWKVCLAE
ncbi:MAG: glycoside hydrolase family 127 protein [Abditibacteriota bacterium]|nr:glycoside hydrolase family 127 protein [Abditibacteriota bacterium]